MHMDMRERAGIEQGEHVQLDETHGQGSESFALAVPGALGQHRSSGTFLMLGRCPMRV